jgi:oligoribonuclease
MTKKAKLLWIDLEMTGLEPAHDRILEVAAIATDWDFTEIATYEAVVKVDQSVINNRMTGQFWQDNHEALEQLTTQNERGIDSLTVERELIGFIKKHFLSSEKIDSKRLIT